MNEHAGRLQNKVAIITGSSNGIGRAIALRFSAEGAHVVCADAEETSREVEGRADEGTHNTILDGGGSTMFVRTRLGDGRDMENLIQVTVREYGRLDIFVNNTGLTYDLDMLQPIWSADETLYDEVQLKNAKSVFLGCKYASRQMLDQESHPNGDRGWIINLSSVFGLVGTSNFASYCASKGAIVNMTKAIALDCAPHRIHVNAICPGWTQAQMTGNLLMDEETQEHIIGLHPFRGLGIPDDVARAAVFLASDDSSWVTGIALPVDGGYTAR